MEDKEKEKEKGPGTISRRDFIKDAGLLIGGAAAGAAAGAGITYAVAPTKEVVKEVVKEVTTGVPALEPEESVLTEVGQMGFGGTAQVVRIDYKNGRIVRLRPHHYEEAYTKEELASSTWKMEVKGKTFELPLQGLEVWLASSYKKRTYSPNRIRYPLKRVDWEPGGDPAKINPQNRGKSKFKRISWDEATTIIANEIKRIQAKYGPLSICLSQDGHGQTKVVAACHGCGCRLLNYMGGYTLVIRNPDSWEGWYWGAKHMWGEGSMGNYAPQTNLFLDQAKNTEMFLNFGDWNTIHARHGQTITKLGYFYKELGIKQVWITPDLNYTGCCLADKWIPVLPNTDAALHLGVSYIFMTEGLYDKDYVATHVYGFDKYQDYVLGKEDGVPKTPQWASKLCGVPVWTIKALAREWAKKKTIVTLKEGGPGARGPYGHEFPRLVVCNLAMQGLGRPGVHQWCTTIAGPNNLPAVSIARARRDANPEANVPNPQAKQIIARTFFPQAVLQASQEKPISWYGTTHRGATVEDQFKKYTYPLPKAEGGTEIHMLWSDRPCETTNWNNGNMFIKAYRSPKIEFHLVQHPWLEDDCYYADIILPITTTPEDDDVGLGGGTDAGGIRYLYLSQKAVKPLGEAMTDYEAVGEIAKKLGKYNEYTEGKTYADWIKYGWETSGVKDLVTWEKLTEKEFFPCPIQPDWEAQPAGMIAFYQDPVKNPLKTKSGKIEFYAQWLAENFPNDKDRGPVPHWITGGPGAFHDESLVGERAKKYPLLLVSNHPRWREHATCDDVTWLREIPLCKVRGYDGYMYEPVWIHPVTAAERGIKHGDIVKLYNERGTVLGGAYVTERIRPGAVSQDHGARIDEIIPGELDRGGANNLICPLNILSANAAGMVCSGFLVEVKKVDPAEMEEWRQKYPEAFARPYDPAAGLVFDAWIEGGV